MAVNHKPSVCRGRSIRRSLTWVLLLPTVSRRCGRLVGSKGDASTAGGVVALRSSCPLGRFGPGPGIKVAVECDAIGLGTGSSTYLH
jgi:hypothetical protein